MKTLNQALLEIANIMESMKIPYAVMGGMAVRIYGIPRPTHDVDFTIAVARDSLPEFFRQAELSGYTIAEPNLRGWVDTVADMPLVKLRMYVDQHGVDIEVFRAETPFQQSVIARRRFEGFEDQNGIVC